MRSLISIFLIVMMWGCMPEQPIRTVSSDLSDSSTDVIEGTKNPADSNFETIQWYAQSQYTKTLTINSSNNQNSYFRGDDVYNFLIDPANYSGTYCMVVNFTQTSTTSPNQLRVLVIPQKTVNYATSETIYFFRVNLNTDSGNNNCDVPFESFNASSGSYVNTTYAGTIAHKPSTVCTNCQNIVSSSDVKIYRLDGSKLSSSTLVLTQIEKEKIDFTPIILRININNDTTNVGSCSTSLCRSLGYDCCADNQCVNDAQIKPTVDQITDDDFKAAELEKTLNPAWYRNYPQYYYACLVTPPIDDPDGDLDPADPNGEAAARLVALKADYECILELDENTDSEPFQIDINTTYTQDKCELSDTTDNLYYQTVIKRLYQNCGCAYSTFSDMVANCPAYTYRPIYATDSSGVTTSEIQDIVCQSPEPEQDKQPFQDLTVSLNSKSAPHRFFNEDGIDISYYLTNDKAIPTSVTTNTTQEGESFQYLDTDKILPLSSDFSMNSILGQMSFPLTSARPAKVIELEFDKMYYIATISGYYTPCPNCAKDSWFTNFSAYPVTTQGVGLRSIGYSTKRDEWGSNNTFGNYEDTIFGRACWLPPTMIPWSHSPNSDVQTQRENRLKTQAALYINGYQRDWFGFNKGAVIGSFDGVTWFAIGKGRIVKSTSSKLFLAINAPFADLAEPTDHTVTVQEYDFVTTGARFDYNPDVSLNSPFQNEGGSCQANHICETDSDCITKLGWEYVCGNPYSLRTKWPVFDPTTAEEEAGQSRSSSIVYLLQQGEMAGDTTNAGRCIYRGAGAPCRTNYASLLTDENKRKSLACAPNFYCAPLTTASVFNREVARFAAPLENLVETNNHFYGQDANILGRPKDYIAANGNLYSLPLDVRNTLNENLAVHDTTIGSNTGICLPGKVTPTLNAGANVAMGFDDSFNWDPRETHSTKDPEIRTDFISQIGGCNSGLYTRMKHISCPILDSDGNYLYLKTDVLNYDHDEIQSAADFRNVMQSLSSGQNACGMESLHSSVTLSSRSVNPDDYQDNSPYKFLEARTLASDDVITEPTFARDACFRKAGAVCHTNYDCYPNKKHSELIDVYGLDYFGNYAEMAFHQEYLVCGQGQSPPVPSSADYNSYDMTQNVCCREVGQDLTMYTENEVGLAPSGEEFTETLEVDKFSAFFPNDVNRYSRYSVISPVISPDTRLPLNNATYEFVKPSAKLADILNGDQWKTINRTAQRTCCGGGWIRKFADGSTNWSISRFNYDIDNFKCLNYKSPLLTATDTSYWGETDLNLVRNERAQYCWDTTDQQGNCVSLLFDAPNDLATFLSPYPEYSEVNPMDVYTKPTKAAENWADNNYSFSMPLSADALNLTYLPWSAYPDPEVDFRHNIMIRVPTWVTFADSDNDGDLDSAGTSDFHATISDDNPGDGVGVFLETHDGGEIQCDKAIYTAGASSELIDYNDFYHSTTNPVHDIICPDTGSQKCCYEYTPENRVLKVAFNDAGGVEQNPENTGCSAFGPSTEGACSTADASRDYYLKLRFKAAGTVAWEEQRISDPTIPIFSNLPEVLNHRRSSRPGNSSYYLERFGRFELTGIPQMTYLPIYCNDNYQKMVPGLFIDELNTVGRFNTLTSDFTANPTLYTNHEISGPNIYGLEDEDNCAAAATGGSCAAYDNSNEAITPAHLSISAATHSALLNKTVVVTDKAVMPEPVFSSSSFKCCLELGQATTSADLCCSGFSATNQSAGNNDPNSYCKLPQGTNLNVYFNRFVSGEGVDEDMPVTALTEDDFYSKTGEPKLTTAVLQKLSAIGTLYCQNGTVRRGSALGEWGINIEGQADSRLGQATAYNFVDFSGDREVAGGSTPRTGLDFMSGYRWNHHIYCD